MSKRGGKQCGICYDFSFNLCLTWPSGIAKSDLLHDGCSGTTRLAQTTSGRNLGVFVSAERRGLQNCWVCEFSSSPPLILSPSFFPSQPSHISIFFRCCHSFMLPLTRGGSQHQGTSLCKWTSFYWRQLADASIYYELKRTEEGKDREVNKRYDKKEELLEIKRIKDIYEGLIKQSKVRVGNS